jgi:hypothetical protein
LLPVTVDSVESALIIFVFSSVPSRSSPARSGTLVTIIASSGFSTGTTCVTTGAPATFGPVYGTYGPYTSVVAGAVVIGTAALGLGVNGLGAGAISSLVIGAESGCETPIAGFWANTGAAARTRAAVVMRNVIAISS